MDNKKLIGKRIKEIRKLKGLTQEKLSEIIGIETCSLSGIESGRSYPSLHILNKIATVLDVEMIEFFRFSTVDIPENIEIELENIIKKQNKENKILIYKILRSIFSVV